MKYLNNKMRKHYLKLKFNLTTNKEVKLKINSVGIYLKTQESVMRASKSKFIIGKCTSLSNQLLKVDRVKAIQYLVQQAIKKFIHANPVIIHQNTNKK